MNVSTEHSLSCISWNIHRGRGADGRVDPERTLNVLRDEVWRAGTHALFLQEADAEAAPHKGVLSASKVEAITGLRHVQSDRSTRSDPTSDGFLGVTAYLHPSFQVMGVRLVDLPGHCPRGAVVIDATRQGHMMTLVTTHLSLSQALRIVQMRTLNQNLQRFGAQKVIFVGDLNEWRPWGGLALSRRVMGQRYSGPARATFPARRPLLPLDRVLAAHPASVDALEVLTGPGIRLASDHLPIKAQVRLAPP